MSSTDDKLERKQAAARAAMKKLLPNLDERTVIGVGTGSTVACFIEELKDHRSFFEAAVASSADTETKLKAAGIPVYELNSTGSLPFYVDGADSATESLQLIKGGGAALTREKIIASASQHFICMIDDSKLVSVLGDFPLPVEVIPMARSYVAREIVKMGGDPVFREGVTTDNGNQILDVHNLHILDPVEMETRLNNLAGVVCNGLFAHRPADLLLIAGPREVRELRVRS